MSGKICGTEFIFLQNLTKSPTIMYVFSLLWIGGVTGGGRGSSRGEGASESVVTSDWNR